MYDVRSTQYIINPWSKETPVTVIEGGKAGSRSNAVLAEDQTTYFAPRPMVGVKAGV